MPTPFHGLRTSIFHVADLELAKAWYSRVLETEPYFDQPFYVGYNIGGYELGLHPLLDGDTAGTTTITYWGVDSADTMLARLVALGATVHHPISDVGDGIRIGSVRDPFGNLFGVIENPHFKLE